MLEEKKTIDEALARNNLLILVGNANVKYFGRASSKLSNGDRLVIVKPDGTFLVHQNSGMKAINYQGPGSIVKTFLSGDKLILKSERLKPVHEAIEVEFTGKIQIHSFSMHDDKKINVIGSEKQLAVELEQNIGFIEKNLKILTNEADVKRGFIDLLAQDSEGNLVAIELKRRRASLDAVTQLERYVTELRKRKNVKVRGIVCAPGITPNALKLLESRGFQFFNLKYDSSQMNVRIEGLEKKQNTLNFY